MGELSSLITEIIEKSEYGRAFYTKPNEKGEDFDLFIEKPYGDSDEYTLRSDFHGSKEISNEGAIRSMLDFIKGISVGKTDGSELHLELCNNQVMDIRSYNIPELESKFYKVTFLASEISKDATALTSVLAGIARDVYELNFEDNPSEEHSFSPFIMGQDPSKGVVVSITSGMKYGTIPEKRTREIIGRFKGQLNEEEIKTLRSYDAALVDELPDTQETKGCIIQKAGELDVNKFINLLGRLPSEVASIGIMLFGDKVVHVDNKKYEKDKSGIPSVHLYCSSKDKGEIDRYVDHVWDNYHRITKIPVEEVLKWLDKEE